VKILEKENQYRNETLFTKKAKVEVKTS